MKFKVFIPFFIGIFLGFSFANLYPGFQSFETRRMNVIADMNDAINQQVEEGEYRCCIKPACTMCFMGGWIWKDGICRCDDMIAKGEDDKVCPQCKRGLEEGKCKYTLEEKCELWGGNMKKIKLKIKGMHCPSCEMVIKDALEEIGVKSSKINSGTGQAEIEYNEKKITRRGIRKIIEREGYKV